jgi:hypothetical protein
MDSDGFERSKQAHGLRGQAAELCPFHQELQSNMSLTIGRQQKSKLTSRCVRHVVELDLQSPCSYPKNAAIPTVHTYRGAAGETRRCGCKLCDAIDGNKADVAAYLRSIGAPRWATSWQRRVRRRLTDPAQQGDDKRQNRKSLVEKENEARRPL